MSSNDHLNQLANEVARWRSNRKSRTEQMPIEYVQRAFELSKQVSQTEIEKKVKIFRYQFKRLSLTDSGQAPTVQRFDVLTPNSFSIELGSGMRIDCQVGTHNFANVITTVARSLQRGPHA